MLRIIWYGFYCRHDLEVVWRAQNEAFATTSLTVQNRSETSAWV